VSSFTGKQEKILHIYTDDKDHPDQIFTAVIEVPVVVSVEPKLLQWIIGQEPAVQDFSVKILGDDPINVTNINATRKNVTCELKVITPGREYRISVKPADTQDVTIGAVQIQTDSKIPKYQRQMGFFSIVRPEQAEKQVKN